MLKLLLGKWQKQLWRLGFNHTSLALLGGALLYLCWVSYSNFQGFPLSTDEYSFLYTAQMYLRGYLTFPVSEDARAYTELYTVIHGGRLFPKYGPGFSLILLPFLFIKLEWLVNPLISVIGLGLVYLCTLQLFNRFVAIWSLVVMVTSAYFFGYAASFYSQALINTLTTLIFYCLLRYDRQHQFKWVLIIFLSLGLMVISRPLDAGIALVMAGIGIILTPHSFQLRAKSLLGIGGGFVAIVFLFCSYNYLLSGRFAVSTYPVFNTHEFSIIEPNAKDFLSGARTIFAKYKANFWQNLVPNLTINVAGLTGYFFWMIAFLGLISRPQMRWTLLALFIILLNLALYNFQLSSGWPQYGHRYLYGVFGLATILFGAGLHQAMKLADRFQRRHILMVAGVILGAVLNINVMQSITKNGEYGRRFAQIAAIQHDLIQRCRDYPFVVLHSPRRALIPYVEWDGFKRNPFMEGRRFLTSNQQEDIAKLPPGEICNYRFDLGDIDKQMGKRAIDPFEINFLGWSVPFQMH